jgi:glyoxylase-like metal-dependent hydrolase (beta-lactamase superfamily II)
MLADQAAWLGMETPENVIVDQDLADGDRLRAGNLSALVMHTPGHTEGSVCLYMEAQQKLIAGDTLFSGSIGRTDLPGGSYDKIMQSLHQRVLALPDDTEVVPGHGPITYIGVERESNPFLK